MKVRGFGVKKAKDNLEEIEVEVGDLQDDEVVIKIICCGLCWSDVEMIDNNWGSSEFPLIPGHEVVGIIEKVGSKIENLVIGDRVGIGWQCGSCGECEMCNNDFEQLCPEMKETIVSRQGGMADLIKISGEFVHKIPDKLKSEAAAVLMCAGITTYQPMKYFGVKSGMKLGVVGIGGLGHMAIKFANAMGAEVWAFSTNKNKKEEAEKMGAKRFFTDWSDETLNGKLDFIVVASNNIVDYDRFLEILKPLGKLCLVGLPKEQVKISSYNFVGGQKSVVGGSLGGRKIMNEMLMFAAENNINPEIEILPMNEANRAIEKLKRGEVRYRIVLEN